MWNKTMDVYSAEMNGFLDRDNLPAEAIGVAHTSYNSTDGWVFVNFTQYATDFTLDLGYKGWQEIPVSVSSLASSVEEMMEVEASIQVETDWIGGEGVLLLSDYSGQVQFRISVDGMHVCETGKLSLHYQEMCATLVGATPLTTSLGRKVAVEVRFLGGKKTNPDEVVIQSVDIIWTRYKR